MLFAWPGVERPSRVARSYGVTHLIFPESSKYPLHTNTQLCTMLHMARRIAVILSDEEYEQVKLDAGIAPLSAYFRALAVRPRIVASGSSPESKEPVEQEFDAAKKKSITCAHGTQKGYRCWQCKGIAVI